MVAARGSSSSRCAGRPCGRTRTRRSGRSRARSTSTAQRCRESPLPAAAHDDGRRSLEGRAQTSSAWTLHRLRPIPGTSSGSPARQRAPHHLGRGCRVGRSGASAGRRCVPPVDRGGGGTAGSGLVLEHRPRSPPSGCRSPDRRSTAVLGETGSRRLGPWRRTSRSAQVTGPTAALRPGAVADSSVNRSAATTIPAGGRRPGRGSAVAVLRDSVGGDVAHLLPGDVVDVPDAVPAPGFGHLMAGPDQPGDQERADVPVTTKTTIRMTSGWQDEPAGGEIGRWVEALGD